MRNVSRIQKKIAAVRKAISQGQDGLAWMLKDVEHTYMREFPDQIFMTIEEMLMAVDMLGVLVEYYVYEGKKTEAIKPLLEMSKMVDEVVEKAPFSTVQKERLIQQKLMYKGIFDNADATNLVKQTKEGDYNRVVGLSEDLMAAVDAKDAVLMQEISEELDSAYKEEYGDSIESFESFFAFCKMHLAAVRYCAFNNMYGKVQHIVDDIRSRFDGFRLSNDFSSEQMSEVYKIVAAIEEIGKATPRKHRNLVVGRDDTRCTLCRIRPANKTGSHMVPNFLSHPTFSWDGKGKRGHEALNHAFLNELDQFCTFYGQDVPEWRFARGEGKENISDEDIDKNVNQLEYDNEFCSECENRFGVLETVYAQFYNGQKKKISPRVAYLFWMSVLWRMSMGSMSIFMDMNDEMALRELLDKNILATEKEIAESNSDLGNWKYAMFRAHGLQDGDKGILGSRMEYAPYVVSYNNLVMVFFNHDPSDEELTVGPITVKRDNLCDWSKEEKSEDVDRRWFWDVRDWFVASSYQYRDPVRERALRIIRENERSTGNIMSKDDKDAAIKLARVSSGPQNERLYTFHKMERITGAFLREKEAREKGYDYDPLADDDLFLTEKDFQLYYEDLAKYARGTGDKRVKEFPYYKEARDAIKDEKQWRYVKNHDEKNDAHYINALDWMIDQMSPDEVQKAFPFLYRGRNRKKKDDNRSKRR